MSPRPRAWSDTRFAVASLVAGTRQDFDLLLNAPTVDTLTVVRIIGELWFMYSPNSTVVDSLSIVDLAIGVGSVQSFDVGGGSPP